MLSQNPEPKLKYSKITIFVTSHFGTLLSILHILGYVFTGSCTLRYLIDVPPPLINFSILFPIPNLNRTPFIIFEENDIFNEFFV